MAMAGMFDFISEEIFKIIIICIKGIYAQKLIIKMLNYLLIFYSNLIILIKTYLFLDSSFF
jgi:hypothetical protein